MTLPTKCIYHVSKWYLKTCRKKPRKTSQNPKRAKIIAKIPKIRFLKKTELMSRSIQRAIYLPNLKNLPWFIRPRLQQGKSEGFESCDRPIVRKCPIWVKIGDVLFRVALKFDGWPWKTIGHLSFAVSSFVQHFIAIGEFKLELQSGNAQSRSVSTIFLAVWPWNLTDDLQKQKGTSSLLLQALCRIS